MPYIKTVLVIVVTLALVVSGVQNTHTYVLDFMQWQLVWPLPLWVLLMIAFFAGTLPIFIVGLPDKTAYFTRMHSLRSRQRRLEKELKAIDRAELALKA